MKNVFILLFSIGVLMSCEKNDIQENSYPKCLQEGVEAVLEGTIQTPKSSIKKYLYNEETVYLVSFQNFPDGVTSVVDSNCNTICSSGGIGGFNTCEDFENNATFIELVWEDPR